MAADIYIAGTGTVGYRQLTEEVKEAFKKSETIYLLHHQELVKEYLDEEFARVVDVSDEYNEEEVRSNTYQRIADRVLEGALGEHSGPVTFATYGHPMLFVDSSRILMEEAPSRDLDVEVMPGTSALDCLYTDIGLDPAINGLQIYDATDILVREADLNPRTPAMILQIGSVESVLYSTRKSKPERFTNIKNHLQQFYPDDHEVYLLQTATFPISDSEQTGFELQNFDTEQVSEQVRHIHTLYIPPYEVRSVENNDMLEKIQSPEHLRSITKSDQK